MISIIIPTYNEAEHIGHTIACVHATVGEVPIEIIVADGGSNDDTLAIARQCGARALLCGRKGRAAQMNEGAAAAQGVVLYFLHADSLTPPGFAGKIWDKLKEGYASGCFRLKFDHKHWFLRANAWFTRFDLNAIRFGDQSLYVLPDVFRKCGGFREDLLMMEDQEIIHRIRKHGKFAIIDDQVTTSARKYLDNGIYRMQGIFFYIWFLYYLGYSQDKLLILHRKLIHKHKL